MITAYSGSSVLVTGKTFDHKEALKALGGKWEPDKKGWIIPGKNALLAAKIMGEQLPTSLAPQPGVPNFVYEGVNVGTFNKVSAAMMSSARQSLFMFTESGHRVQLCLPGKNAKSKFRVNLYSKFFDPLHPQPSSGYYYGYVTFEGRWIVGDVELEVFAEIRELLASMSDDLDKAITHSGKASGTCPYCGGTLFGEAGKKLGFHILCSQDHTTKPVSKKPAGERCGSKF